jgi:hypothetical protein
VEGCCYILAGKVVKKRTQESLHSEEYYQEDGIKLGGGGSGDEVSSGHKVYFGGRPRNSGTNGDLCEAGTGNGLLKPSAERKEERHDNTSSRL